MQFGMSRLLAVGNLQHLRTQAGAAHAQQQRMRKACLGGVGSGGGKLRELLKLLFDNAQPADPFVFIVAGPEGWIAAPETGHFVSGLPVVERRLHRLRERRRKFPAGGLDHRFRAHRFLFFCSTAAISLANASAKRLMASSRSWSVTFCMEMPAFSRFVMVASAAARSASSVRSTVPWSRKASMVAGGMVLTVSGPISSSTYSTSRYLGFLVLVLAHSRRCVCAPRAAKAFQRGLAIRF